VPLALSEIKAAPVNIQRKLTPYNSGQWRSFAPKALNFENNMDVTLKKWDS
jgi:hypothetical protein